MIINQTLISLVALLGWGTSDYLAGKGGESIDPAGANFVIQLVNLLFVAPVALVFGLPHLTQSDAVTFFATSAFFTLGYFCMIKALGIGPVGVASPIANSYPVFTVAISVTLLGVAITSHELVAISIVIIGAILLSFEKIRTKKRLHESTVLLALTSAVSWGVAFAIVGYLLDEYKWYQIPLVVGIFQTVISGALYFVMRGPGQKVNVVFSDKFSILSGVTFALGWLAFIFASEKLGSVVIPAVIASASPLVTSYLARLHDHERLVLQQRIGAIMVVAGIMYLNVN